MKAKKGKKSRELEKRVKCEKTRTQEERERGVWENLLYNTLYFFPQYRRRALKAQRAHKTRERERTREPCDRERGRERVREKEITRRRERRG